MTDEPGVAPATRDAAPPSPGRARWALAAALGVATAALYLRSAGHEFVQFDDNRYVTENPVVRNGLSWAGIAWAFTTFHASNWHPLTWLAHMLDVELFGLAAGGHHVVNVLLHAANAALVLLVLARMTGAPRRSALVAALFAVHPLHVESVAWVAERKDLLSTAFGLLALLAWARYVDRPAPRRYAAVALAFAASLLAKPMWVTFPFLLLLLDFWPLGRTTSGPPPEVPDAGRGRLAWPRLVLEKAPLLALATTSSAVTVVAQSRGESITGLELGLGARVGNAAVSYLHYLRDTAWPSSLSVFYPHPRGGLGAGVAVLSTAVVLVVTAVLLWRARRLPAVAVGWCWFVGTLVPVIGLVQVGAQARADRYTYLPSLGLFVAAVWGGHALAARWRATPIAAAAAAAAVGVLSVLTFRQLGHWETHEALFRHAVEVSPENAHARAILSKELRRQGRLDESLELARASVRLDAGDARYWNNLALSARALGRVDEARWALGQAAALDPRELGTWLNLGRLEADAGNLPAAEAAFRQATVAAPESPVVWKFLGAFLAGTGRPPEAIAAYQRAVKLAPGDREALFQLGSVQVAAGLPDDARATAARLRPLAPDLARELGARAERAPGR